MSDISNQLCYTLYNIMKYQLSCIRTQCVRNIQVCLGKLREVLTEEIEHELIFDRRLGAFQVDGGGKELPRRKGRMYTKHKGIFVD